MKNIILTGLNGYGGNFIEALLMPNGGSYQLVAVVSGNSKKSSHYEILSNYGIRFYENIESCLEREKVDIAIITTPMHIHYQEVMAALQKGVSLYCEKPLAPTLKECIAINTLATKQNCVVAVGFQWSFSKGILDLKKDILNNRFGKMQQIKTVVNWNRRKSYYTESNWKGRQFDINGAPMFENVMSNGTAHYFHNLLFLSGKQLNTSATPIYIEGECYKGHNIETFDTASIRMKTDSQCELLYLATFVSDNTEAPRFEITFENGKVNFPEGEDMLIKAILSNGETIYYDSPDQDRYGHFKQVVDYLHHGTAITCDVNTTLPEVLVANTVSKYFDVTEFPKELIQEDTENLSVMGISEIMNHCYKNNQLISEANVSWTQEKVIIQIKDLTN